MKGFEDLQTSYQYHMGFSHISSDTAQIQNLKKFKDCYKPI